MTERVFRGRDELVVRVSESSLKKALRIASEAGDQETGGIIIGFYDDTLMEATITELMEPPLDSRATRFTFVRGIRGLMSRLKDLWGSSQRRYYLGEWHFHPYERPIASHDDKIQMRSIASSERYKCPEPVLLILGGDPRGVWSLTVSIHFANAEPILLTELE